MKTMIRVAVAAVAIGVSSMSFAHGGGFSHGGFAGHSFNGGGHGFYGSGHGYYGGGHRYYGRGYRHYGGVYFGGFGYPYYYGYPWGYGWPYYGYGYGYPYGYGDGRYHGYRRGEPGYQARAAEVAVQRALRRRGYYSGPIDGQHGPQTHGAIRKYQRDRGLAVTGMINRGLLRSLGI